MPWSPDFGATGPLSPKVSTPREVDLHFSGLKNFFPALSMHALISLGPRQLDCTRNVLVTETGEIQLSPIASRFLQVLAVHPGEVVTRQTLIDRLWDGNALIGEPALNRVVSELRKATGDTPGAPTLVQTIPRKGYRLVPAQTEAALGPAPPWFRWPGWKMTIAVLVVVVVAGLVINWTVDTAIGLIWVANHSD